MAFFEKLETLYEQVSNLLKLVGTRSFGGWLGDPTANYIAGDVGGAIPLQSDGDGMLGVRAAVLTDEGSFRSDFYHTETELTGTATFENGSTVVTGSGTSFFSELDRDSFIRLSSHSVDKYVQIGVILSDTELELSEPYQGASGSGATVEIDTPYILGAGGTVTLASSKMEVSSGVTSGSETYGYRWADYSPIFVDGVISISDRRANQVGCFGLMEAPCVDDECAHFQFEGTDATVVKCITGCHSDSSSRETTTATMPFGSNTSTYHRYRIELDRWGVVFLVDDTIVAIHRTHVPEVYESMCCVWGWKNTGVPAGASTLSIDSIYVQNVNLVEVRDGGKGSPLPTRSGDDVHTMTGSLTTTATTETTILSYTVPAGKTAYLTGFSVSAGTTTVNAAVRIGKGSIPITAPAAPGSFDSSCIRALFLQAKTNIGEDYSAAPRYLAGPGEVIRASIKPDGVTSTTWVMSMDVSLR